jgi:hypothetical protein
LAPFIEILQLSFYVMNYAHLVHGMQMASAARAWMYKQPQEDWENFLSGVNGFLNQAEADMRDRSVQAMLCPCIDCLNQKKFAQRKIIFHHLANRGAPVRVAWYFCIIPRLRRWFATRKEAQLLHWHAEGRKELNYKKDGKFRHPADAAQWGNIYPLPMV